MDGVDDGAGVFQWATGASAEFAAHPAGVDEPAAGLGFLHLRGEHGCVSAWLYMINQLVISNNKGMELNWRHVREGQ